MAEAADSSQSKPVPTSTPEPDLDALLSQLPQFKEAFGPPKTAAQSGDTQTAENESAPPDTEDTPATPAEESGLPEAEPLEEGEPAPEETLPETEPEGLPDSVQKRIDVLTAKRKSAEERAAALEAENSNLKAKAIAPAPVAPSPASPLADIETPDALAQRLALVQQTKTWAITNLDGGDVDMGEGKTKYLDGTQVKALLAKAEEMLSIHFPQRYQFIQNKAQFDSEARATYPALFKPGTEEQQEFHSWLTVFPECRKYPDIALIVGDALTGRKIRLAKAQKGQQKGNGQTPPLATPAPAAAPRVVKPRTLSEAELSAIATDSSGKALDKFVDQLIAGGRQAQAATRSQRSQR